MTKYARFIFNFLRLARSNNTIADLDRLHASAVISESNLDKAVSAARNSSIVSSSIGRYSSIGRNTKISHTEMGSFCSISWDCTINASSHPLDRLTTHAFPYVPHVGGFVQRRSQEYLGVSIGHDVWVGAQAIILPGVNVGHGAVIGAGSIVTRDVKPYEIVVGNPANHLRWRFDSRTRQYLITLQWWDWPFERLKRNISLFQAPVSFELLESIQSD